MIVMSDRGLIKQVSLRAGKTTLESMPTTSLSSTRTV